MGKKHFPEGEIVFCMTKLIIAGQTLHSNNIAHLDIFTVNILLDMDGYVVLGDFGIARDKTHEHKKKFKNEFKGISYGETVNIDFFSGRRFTTSLLHSYKNIVTFSPDHKKHREKLLRKHARSEIFE